MIDRIKGLLKQLRALVDKEALERELDEEIEFHVAREIEQNVAAGMEPSEARRRALLAFRGRERFKEEVRDARWTRIVEDAIGDLRYGLRSLARRPGFAVAAVLTLALGIGGATAVFSVVKPVLFEPLPYPGGEQIVTISDVAPGGGPLPVTFGTYREAVERSRSFDALAVVKPWYPILTGEGRPERLDGQRVSAAYFEVLGVSPALGRDFEPADDRLGGPDVAIIDDGLWRTRFGADPDVVGRRVTLDGDAFTIVGVMPPGFENVVASAARFWAPLQYDPSLASFQGREWGHHLQMLGRLRPDIGLERASREVDRIAADPVDGFSRPPWASLDHGFLVTSLRESVTRASRPVLLAVLGAVALLLLIACVNVTNLLLARGARRREELAMRAALGAGRPRLLRQLITESLLLAVLGGTVGLALAAFGVRTLVAVSPPGLPRVAAIQMDDAVFAAALGISSIVGVVVGLVPALRASRQAPRHALQRRSRGTAGGDRIARGALVAAQVAISLVLLVAAGLLVRSLDRLFAVDPGFEASRVLTLQVQTSGDRFTDDDAVWRYFSRVVEEVRAVPGVDGAALTSQLPLSGQDDRYGVQILSAPAERDRKEAGVFRYTVSPGYLRVMGIPLRRGRLFEERDDADGAPTALISESLARRRIPDRDPVGQQIHVGGRPDWPPYTVVGVVGDVSQISLSAGRSEGVYVPRSHWYFADDVMWIVVRTEGRVVEPADLAPSVKAAIWSVDEDQPIVAVTTMDELLDASASTRRFALWIFQAFAFVALVLATVGVYGVTAGNAVERRREIGVRSALGATRGDLLAMVVRQGMLFTGLGVVIGLAGAAVSSRMLDSLLYGVSRLDPVTYLGVTALLVSVAAVACAVPAWRAARVDPTIALRVD